MKQLDLKLTQISKQNQLELEVTEVIVQIKIEQQNQKMQILVLKEVLVKKELKIVHLQVQNQEDLLQKTEEQTQVLKTTN